MRLRPIIFLCFLLISRYSFAQQDRYESHEHQRPMAPEASILSVFSENGEPFYLVLNGAAQNNTPTSKIRVEGLPQYGNDVRIMFADGRTPEINRRINIADPVDGREVNMTLKIVRDRDGYAKLKFQKCAEIDHQYRPEQDEYVMSYGQPRHQDGQQGRGYDNAGHGDVVIQPVPSGPVAMDPQSFNDAKQSIIDALSDNTKLSTAKTILASNNVNTNQVIEICRLFSFDDSKLDFAKFAYSKTVDPNNYYKVGSVFDFDSKKQALNDFITGGGR